MVTSWMYPKSVVIDVLCNDDDHNDDINDFIFASYHGIIHAIFLYFSDSFY